MFQTVQPEEIFDLRRRQVSDRIRTGRAASLSSSTLPKAVRSAS